MSAILDKAFDYVLAASFALLFFSFAVFFMQSRPHEWKIGEIKLSPIRWFVVVGSVFAIVLAAKSALNFWLDWQNDSEVPSPDQSRYTFLVPDFSGEGGKVAADIVAGALQRTLGLGVQVLRTPRKESVPEGAIGYQVWGPKDSSSGSGSAYYGHFVPLSSSRNYYGDIRSQALRSIASSMGCARAYHGDAVIWGDYFKETQQVRLSFTVKGPCEPSACGAIPPDPPGTYAMTDISSKESAVKNVFSRSIAVVGGAPVILLAQGLGKQCLARPEILHQYIEKSSNFLQGKPEKMAPRDTSMVLTGLALAEAILASKQKNLALNDSAIQHFEEIKAVSIPDFQGDSVLYGSALYTRLLSTHSLTEQRRYAGRLSALEAPADNRDLGSGLSEIQGNAWLAVFDTGGTFDELNRGYTSWEKARELTPQYKDRTFSLSVQLAGTAVGVWHQTHSFKEFDTAKKYVNQMISAHNAFSRDELKRVDIHDRYLEEIADLGMTDTSDDMETISYAINFAVEDPRLAVRNWKDEDYGQFVLALGRAYVAAYRVVHESRMVNEAISLDNFVLRNTGRSSENYARSLRDIGFAKAEIAFATGDEAARKAATQYLAQSAQIESEIGQRDLATAINFWAREIEGLRIPGMPRTTLWNILIEDAARLHPFGVRMPAAPSAH